MLTNDIFGKVGYLSISFLCFSSLCNLNLGDMKPSLLTFLTRVALLSYDFYNPKVFCFLERSASKDLDL